MFPLVELARITMATWSNDLFGCFTDMNLCLVTYFAPCYTTGKNAEAMGENCMLYGCFTLCGVGVITDSMIREKIRVKYGIEGSFINDILCNCFCPFCTIIQAALEIKEHGGGKGAVGPAPNAQAVERQ